MRYPFLILALGMAGPVAAASVGTAPAVTIVQAPTDGRSSATMVDTGNQDKEDMGDGSRQICRKIEVTGSRMNTKKVCATATEWAAQKAQNRQAIEQAQNKKWSAKN